MHNRIDGEVHGAAFQARDIDGDVFFAGHDLAVELHEHYGDGFAGARRACADTAADVCPYPTGMAPFRAEQHDWFFGRDCLTAELVDRLDRRLQGAGGLLMVVAPSGAGKSSLLQAGLVSRLEAGALPGSRNWPRWFLTPSSRPMTALAAEIADFLDVTHDEASRIAREPDHCLHRIHQVLQRRASAGDTENARLVVIVDQLEELFTMCRDQAERERFVGLISRLAQRGPGWPAAALVVCGLRADFYARCADYPQLCRALQDDQIFVGPLSRDGLREAIVNPLARANLRIEPGLVDLLLRDLGATSVTDAGAGYEAGRLPLLAHALRATWRERHGQTLTVEGYRATGGIEHAVATSADRVFAALGADERRIARTVFLRLIKIGDGMEDTRLRVPRTEIHAHVGDSRPVATVLNEFTRARLLTQTEHTVEITHEALLRAWPLLHGWVDADRAGNLRRQELEEAATRWESDGRDAEVLLAGNRLDGLLEWRRDYTDDVSPLAQEFLEESSRYQRRGVRRRRSLIALLAAVALFASGAVGFAYQQKDQAAALREAATFGHVVAQADRIRGADASLAAQLDLAAYRMQPGNHALSTNLLATENLPLSTPLTGHTGAVHTTAFSPTGPVMASGSSDGTVRLWDISDLTRPAPIGPPLLGHTKAVNSVAFSPDGHTLASAGSDGSVRLWKVGDPAHPVAIPHNGMDHPGIIYSVAFSPGGDTLASANDDGNVRLWAITGDARLTPVAPVLPGPVGIAYSVTFSPDGHTLATANSDGTLRLWKFTRSGGPVRLGKPIPAHTDFAQAVTFNADGQLLVSAGRDRTVRLWDVTDPVHPTPIGSALTGHTGAVYSVTISPDGRLLASASGDGTVRLWNITNPAHPVPLGRPLTGHIGAVGSVGFSPGNRTLATAGDDHTIRLWNLPGTTLIGHTEPITAVVVSPTGHFAASAGGDGTVRLWDLADPSRPGRLGDPWEVSAKPVNSVAFRPDGQVLATASGDGKVRLWDLTDPVHPVRLGRPLAVSVKQVDSVDFSPDGTMLATTSGNDTVRLWNVATPDRPVLLGRPFAGHAATFRPDGRVLASAGTDQTVQLWDIANPAQPVLDGAPLIGHTNEILAVTFSPDGRTLATSGADQTVRLWNVADPRRASEWGPPLIGHTDSVRSLAFSLDSRTLASASSDQTIQLWDLIDPAHATTDQALTGPALDNTSVEFSRGNILLSGSADQTLRVWTLDAEKAIARLCAATRNILTPQRWRQYVSDETPYEEPCPPKLDP